MNSTKILIEKTDLAIKLENSKDLNFNLETQHPYDAGMDVRACIEYQKILWPGEVSAIPTGLKIELEDPMWEIQVRSRSGLAAKNSIFTLNSPGTVDYEYRNEIMVILANFSSTQFVVYPGDRIAQICVREVPQVYIDYVEKISSTDRGGLGSTGVK